MSKGHLFCSNNAAEIHIFNFWRHQKLLLVAKKLQNSTLLFENNFEDIGISKLVSQLKILPSLFELKDKDTIVMSMIINKLQHVSQNRRFSISEVGKIRLNLKNYSFTVTRLWVCKKDRSVGIFFYFGGGFTACWYKLGCW